MSVLRIVAAVTAGLLVGVSAHALALSMPLAERVAKADFIGVVEVRSVRPSPAAALPEEDRQRSFLQIAEAVVITPVKGQDVPSRITIDFDNGLGCPNVLYERDHVYLVFLWRDAEGSYSTVNYQQGRFEVRGNTIDYWTLDTNATLEQAIADIVKLLGR